MRALRRVRRRSIALLLTIAMLGCESQEPVLAPTTVDVGIHHARFVIPPNWLHVNHGREHIFENQMARISLADLGPVTPAGFSEIIRSARDLFRKNQWEDARTQLDATNPRRFFSSERRWKSVKNDWRRITFIGRRETNTDFEGQSPNPPGVSTEVEWAVEAAFTQLLVEIDALPTADLESMARRALLELGHDEMRDIARSHAMAISGRSAIRIDTWDRLSHSARRDHLFISNAGHLLVLHTEMGSGADLESGFEEIAASLELVPLQESVDGA